MSHFIVGLTGGIGSGKTTVSNAFEALGIDVVDADVVAREVVAPNSPCLNAIEQRFGPEILLEDRNLNRAKLRQIIFDDPEQKQWLDNLMHPAIRQAMLAQLKQATSDYAILVAPLLFENGLERYTNVTCVVDIAPELQAERTVKRDNVPAAQVDNIIKAQISRAERLEKADFVFDNQGDWANNQSQIASLHQKFTELSKMQPDSQT